MLLTKDAGPGPTANTVSEPSFIYVRPASATKYEGTEAFLAFF